MLRVCSSVLIICLGLQTARPESVPEDVQSAFTGLRGALKSGAREKVVGMTFFPFRHPSRRIAPGGQLSRADFVKAFDRIFTPGLRKQIAQGTIHSVTAADIQEAKDDDLDPCGRIGDFIVKLDRADPSEDDEAFWHVVLRRVNGKVKVHRVIACS